MKKLLATLTITTFFSGLLFPAISYAALITGSLNANNSTISNALNTLETANTTVHDTVTATTPTANDLNAAITSYDPNKTTSYVDPLIAPTAELNAAANDLKTSIEAYTSDMAASAPLNTTIDDARNANNFTTVSADMAAIASYAAEVEKKNAALAAAAHDAEIIKANNAKATIDAIAASSPTQAEFNAAIDASNKASAALITAAHNKVAATKDFDTKTLATLNAADRLKAAQDAANADPTNTAKADAVTKAKTDLATAEAASTAAGKNYSDAVQKLATAETDAKFAYDVMTTTNDAINKRAAEEYQALSPITDPNGNTLKTIKTNDFPSFLNIIYRIGIGACFALGVVMFTLAGIQYIVSESMGGKSDARSRINNALIGLAIALVSFILLQTINPDLLKFTSLNISSETQK